MWNLLFWVVCARNPIQKEGVFFSSLARFCFTTCVSPASLSVPSRKTASSHCVSGGSVSWLVVSTYRLISISFLFLQVSFAFVVQVSCIRFSRCLAPFYPHIHYLVVLSKWTELLCSAYVWSCCFLATLLRLCSNSDKIVLPKVVFYGKTAPSVVVFF